MKKITTLAAIGVAAIISTAKAEISPALHGFSFGAHLGYVMGVGDTKRNDVTVNPAVSAGRVDQGTDGVAGGINMGYSFLSNRMVAGLEGSVNFTGNDGNSSVLRAALQPVKHKLEQKTNYSLGVKLGAVAFDNTLLYIRPGVIWSEWKHSTDELPLIGTGKASKTKTGFEIAAGADWAVTQNFTVGGMYAFATYGDMKYKVRNNAGVDVRSVKVSPRTSTFSVVAKYALGGMGK